MSNLVAKLTILGAPRVKKNNQKVVLARGKRGQMYPRKVNTPAYTKWHKEALNQILKQKPALEINYPINLECKFYMPTKGRVDLSALYEGIQDTLAELNVIEDDNYLIVASHDGSGVYVDKERPRMEISITKKEEAPREPLKPSKYEVFGGDKIPEELIF